MSEAGVRQVGIEYKNNLQIKEMIVIMEFVLPTCAKCKIKNAEKACRVEGGKGPAFCPTKMMKEVVEQARKQYSIPEVREFARQASIQEAECYDKRDQIKPYVKHPIKPRLQEICEFAQKMGYKKLGIAFCSGLHTEAAALTRVLESYGYEVVSVICKIGCTPKEEIGITEQQKINIGEPETMCSPITQAEVLNTARTDFNIVLGLCVGHDSLFFKYAQAPTTVFAVKDRVMGHNPLAAIYTLDSYSERFK
ncbi:MAG: DUF1847 domain-containing protein [bacterium]|jgi:uncharacterized metal-binding protein